MIPQDISFLPKLQTLDQGRQLFLDILNPAGLGMAAGKFVIFTPD
jgi:hypothetical protein